jgi:hypothetical protein
MTAGMSSIQEYVDAYEEGAVKYTTWRKVPSVTTAAGFWMDLSMSPGNPVPNYYAATPLRSKALDFSADGGFDGGIDHGNAVAPARKFLHRLTAFASGSVPMQLMLCDYLLYYPFIDESNPAAQGMTNPVPLPRYPTGAGVQIMAVCVAAHLTGGATIQVTYTNSANPPVPGRVTVPVTMSTQNVNGTIISTAPATPGCIGPFLPLQDGDSGVKSIESVIVGGLGDVGLFTLVLVKPLASISIVAADAPTEVEYFRDFAALPRVVDDAYLNFLCLNGFGSLATVQIQGDAQFIWR